MLKCKHFPLRYRNLNKDTKTEKFNNEKILKIIKECMQLE